MRTPRKVFRLKEGYALLITTVFIAISMLLLGGMLNWTGGATLQTERNNLFRASTGGADAATELTMAYMWRDFYNQNFKPASSYISYLPDQSSWPVRFAFSDVTHEPDQTTVITQSGDWSTNWTQLNAIAAPYAGLSAFAANCVVASTATTSNQPYAVSATVVQRFQLAAIPIFQFAVFYNLDMEIDPGAAMALTGPVFSNRGIWARGLATYNSSVSAVGAVSTNSGDPFVSGKTDGSLPTFNQGINSNANSLTLPIGGNTSSNSVRALLGLPPTGIAPYSEAGQDYFVNEANIIVSNSSGGKLTAFYQDPLTAQPLNVIPYDLTNIVFNAPVFTTNYAYSFATNVSFYDFREKKNVQAVQLDVGGLNKWMTNATGGGTFNNLMNLHGGHPLNSVYVYNNANSTGSTLPAVRVANGATLPTNGLTVVTPDPLYVLGNYNAHGPSLNNGTNVANTAPAALIGDAITVLSTNWSDSYNSGNSTTGSRPPAPTTVNAAAFEGIVQSHGSNYSGGVENFLRLLENWGPSTGPRVPLTYNGSIVVMFPSQYATNDWSGNYYSVPQRNWAFDLNFKSLSGLPPLTPEVRALVRQNWAVSGR